MNTDALDISRLFLLALRGHSFLHASLCEPHHAACCIRRVFENGALNLHTFKVHKYRIFIFGCIK